MYISKREIKEDSVKGEYERQVKPNPSQYLKTYLVIRQIFQSLNFYLQNTKRPNRKAASIQLNGTKKGKYGCALCERLFNNQDELSDHVASVH